jgi:acetoin utilization deacetylase AcuC-like enzyme
MADTTGWAWHERYAWHDARGLMDSAAPESLFEPEPSLESGTTKRRLRNLVDASGLLAHLVPIEPRPAGDDVLARVHDRSCIDEVRARSAGAWRDGFRVSTGVVDPWLDEERTVAALPLRAHEYAAVDVASRARPRSSSR